MLAAEVIPYTDFEDRVRKVGREIRKDRYVEVWQELKVIYSAKKWRQKGCGNQ